jgi:hypothetical protein
LLSWLIFKDVIDDEGLGSIWLKYFGGIGIVNLLTVKGDVIIKEIINLYSSHVWLSSVK